MTGEDAVSWGEIARQAAQRLQRAGVDNAEREARWLVEEVSGITPGGFDVEADTPATTTAVARLDRLVERRCGGEPLQYVLGHWPFRTLDLMVDSRVLIPRPETEEVVERALAELDALLGGDRRSAVVVDLGTGSGAIALSIACERPAARVVATDVSPDALAVAAANLAGVGMAGHGVTLVEGSWFEAFESTAAVTPGGVDLIVTNPPYVAADDPLPPEVADHEPHGALVPGPVGTEDLVAIIDGARGWLAPGGVLVAECAPTQARDLVEYALAAGYRRAEVGVDLAGRDRMVVAWWAGE